MPPPARGAEATVPVMKHRPCCAGFRYACTVGRPAPGHLASRTRTEAGREFEMKVSPVRQQVQAGPAAARKPAQESASVMIEIDHVSQVFQTSARKDHLALSDISLASKTAPSSPFLVLPAAASRRCSISSAASSARRKAWRRCEGKAITGPGPDRGPVFQEFALFPWKTVLGNVMYGPRQQGVRSRRSRGAKPRADRNGRSERL